MRRKGLSFYKRRKKIQASAIQDIFFWAGECVLAFAIGCILVFYFMTRLTCVGQAMEPAINSGDSVLVNRFTYLVSAPKPGDVVVFKPNGNERSHYYMRRVIAEPGDKVQIKDGFVYVNGELFETGLGSEQMDYAGVAEEEITIGDGEYFVLGDNRNQSEDSRNADIGNVKKEDIYGKAWFVCLPWENFGPIPKGHS
ncbi:signal peptidase I [Clostridiaceae bacterium Marseille-Q4143]|nr:signal peptidase I [Clostridiaceae bacterium Marseille-Q4143]